MRLLFIDFTIQHLFDDADYPVGGWAVELRAWLQGFRAIGAETAILAGEDASRAAERLGETQLLRVWSPRGRIPGLAYVGRFLPRMVAASRRWRPDIVVHATASINTGLMYLLARILRRPFVYRCASDIDVEHPYPGKNLGSAVTRLYTFGLRRADAYVAQNRRQLDTIRRRFPGKPATILYNPFSAPREAQAPTRAERGYVAWLGVFKPEKNLPLLAALAQALPDIAFRVGGKLQIGMDDAATIVAVRTLEALPNVTLVGYLRRTEVPSFLANALLLLSTSHYEGFSNTFLEAWGAGTPMVAPARVDPDGLIAAKGLGHAPADDAALAPVIRTICDLPPGDYARLSAHCRAYVEAEHDPARLAACFVAFLQEQVLA